MQEKQEEKTLFNVRTAESVRTLIKNGADPNALDENGNLPLNAALAHEKFEVVKAMIANGADHNAKDKNGHTPLIVAIVTSNIEAVKIVLEKGADPNVTYTYENVYDPLHLALIPDLPRNLEILKRLLEFGADPNIRISSSDTALKAGKIFPTLACCPKYMNLCGYTALEVAAKYDDIEAVKILLEKGVDPNLRNENGQTVLDIAKRACDPDDPQIIHLLMWYGAE